MISTDICFLRINITVTLCQRLLSSIYILVIGHKVIECLEKENHVYTATRYEGVYDKFS